VTDGSQVTTVGEMADRLLEIGTGVLGWTSQQTMQTPMPHILLAYKSRIDWAKATNPFGSGEKPKEQKAPQSVASRIRAMFGAIGTRKVNRGDSG
jgi:hypothetical protein